MNIRHFLRDSFPNITELHRYRAAAKFLKNCPSPLKKLTIDEKRDIDGYWKQFGIKYPDYSWFQMYYGVTGIHDPRFIPDSIAHSLIYPYYNFKSHIAGWDDKNVYERLVPNACFPYSLCHCIRGRLYDHEWNFYGNNNIDDLANKIIEELDGNEDIVYKVSCGSFQGKGVKLIKINSKEEIIDILKHHNSNNFILQKRVIQHPFFYQFCSSSSNIIRVISWRHERSINVLSATIRYGVEGAFTDISYVGGKEVANVVGIDKAGCVNERHYTLEGISPITERSLSDKMVPSYNLLIETVKKAHTNLPFFDFVAWDYMIDVKGLPICIEYNVLYPGTILYQFANGPLAGDKTDSFLDFLKKDKSKKVPVIYRL